jgi:hypothetical protein
LIENSARTGFHKPQFVEREPDPSPDTGRLGAQLPVDDMRHSLPILLTTLLLVLAFPAGAQAAQELYASPSGSGSACTQAAPCSLMTGMADAPYEGTLTLAGGSYGSLAQPLAPPPPNENLFTMQGTPGEPTPQLFIDTTGSGPPHSGVYALQLSASATLRDIAITALGAYDEGVEVGSLDHVLVTDTAGPIACQPLGNIADSACIALASGAWAVEDGGSNLPATPATVHYDNDTFFAPNGTAAYLWPVNFELTVDATDTIFDGGTYDIDGSHAGSEGGTLDIVPSYDAFSKVDPVTLIPHPKAGGSYHTDPTAPTFADPETGDIHEANGSSTIDAGTEDNEGGATALGGESRWIGPAMDIGAYEAPEAPSLNTTLAGHDGVAVEVNPEGADTTVTSTSAAYPAGTLTVAPTATVTGHIAAVQLTCAPPVPALSTGCHGTLHLIVAHERRIRKGKRTVTKVVAVTIGSATFALAGGQHQTIAVHLTTAGSASLATAKHKRLAVSLQIVRSDGAGKSGHPLTLVLAPVKAKQHKLHK